MILMNNGRIHARKMQTIIEGYSIVIGINEGIYVTLDKQ